MRSLFLITAALCVSCAPEQHPVEIQFDVRLNGEAISCTEGPEGLRLTDLRFYVSDARLQDSSSGWQSVTMTGDDTWQNDAVALIDLETGEGACLNGSTETNAVLRGSVAGNPGAGLAFVIGVPESLNHADPMIAEAPLGYTEMHWHWASGYKFMRAGVRSASDGFFLHLGSNRCEGTIGNIQGCQGANRVKVEIADFRPAEDVVIIDVGALFAGVDFADNQPGECMSGPANDNCKVPFSAFGIDFSTGASSGLTPAIQVGQAK